jgi:hypothetical protein
VKRVAGPLVAEARGRAPARLVVDDGHQLVTRRWVPPAPGLQELRHLPGRDRARPRARRRHARSLDMSTANLNGGRRRNERCAGRRPRPRAAVRCHGRVPANTTTARPSWSSPSVGRREAGPARRRCSRDHSFQPRL